MLEKEEIETEVKNKHTATIIEMFVGQERPSQDQRNTNTTRKKKVLVL